MNHFGDNVSFIWSVADLLLSPFEPIVLTEVDEGEVSVIEDQLEVVR